MTRPPMPGRRGTQTPNSAGHSTSPASASAALPERAARMIEGLREWEAATGLPELDAPIEIVRAPGRVNLIGEHTDYNEGFVLPAAIDLEIWLAFRPTGERRVRLTSLQLGEPAGFGVDRLDPSAKPGGWVDYVAGTAWAMREAGLPLRGIRGILDSSIPVGSGLSSSAALEMASTWALLPPEAGRPEAARMARIAQRAENRYVGVNSGIMDQFASAAGREGHALLLDCRSLATSYAPIPRGLSLVVCDTSSPHRLETSLYNTRRAECEAAVRIVAGHEPGVRALRDVDEAMLRRYRDEMPGVVARRAEHVVRENARVGETVEALDRGDLRRVGRLFAASHASLRDLFEVSSPELDALVEIAGAVPGVVGARMTGAGFGGCTVNLVLDGAVGALREAVLAEYPRRTGLAPKVYVTRAVEGAGRVA